MVHPSFQVKRAYLAMRKCMDEALQPMGLTAAQFEIIQVLLQQEGGLEHRLLQEQLGISSPTLTNSLDGMIERGLVNRAISLEDARVKQISLTNKAYQLHDELIGKGQDFTDAMFKGFSPHEIGLFLQWLDKLAINMDHNPCEERTKTL